jgi:hypothetical protein
MSKIDDYIQLPDGRWLLKEHSTTPQSISVLPSLAKLRKPQNSSELLDSIVSFIRRFVILSQSQAEAITLWVVHTYVFEVADTTPYLNITSPEKRSGKTRLLETLETLVKGPWFTGRVTAAVLARKVNTECPTLLLDESDAAFQGDKEYAQTLRSMLNTGYRRGGKSSICIGQGAGIGYRDFSTFCPKAIAGIGKLPDTVADRSIPIKLKRRSSNEPVERFRRQKVELESSLLRDQIIQWLSQISLSNIEPEIPNQLDDRASDCWEPLLNIADAAGGDWPKRARNAAIELMTGETREDESLRVCLLGDIQSIFGDTQQFPSVELVNALKQIEEAPWGDLNGRPLDTRRLASLLKPFDIHPKTIRIEDKTLKGYPKADFQDAWNRYLSIPMNLSVTSVTPDSNQIQNKDQNYPKQSPSPGQNVTDNSQSYSERNVTAVTDKTPKMEVTVNKKYPWEIRI